MTSSRPYSILVSVVSHNQAALASTLLNNLRENCRKHEISVVLTLNAGESFHLDPESLGFPATVIRNSRPQGYGANHNAAFRMAIADYFCVLNPDIRLTEDPFPSLCSLLHERKAGVVAPLIVNANGEVEDSARRMPTALRILSRVFGIGGRLEYEIGEELVAPDWLAGMFLMFPRRVFAEMGGFDERYFLYCEDTDLCTRIRLAGFDVLLDPSVRVIHDARRDSHRNARYLAYHLVSLVKFFLSRTYRLRRKEGEQS